MRIRSLLSTLSFLTRSTTTSPLIITAAMTTTTTNGDATASTAAAEYVPPKVWKHGAKDDNKFASINAPTAGARFDKPLEIGRHPLQLYSLATPNGQKVTILLEELLALGINEAEYDAWIVDISKGDQFGSGFVAANPNSKIPVMMDHSSKDDKPTRVFESGAVLLYLADKFAGRHDFLPAGAARTEVLNWLFWQMGSAPYLGGGFGHFYAYASVKQEYPINRFAMETKRQLSVLEQQLIATKAYIAGDVYTIADMAIFPWYGNLVLGHLYGDAATFLNIAEDYPHLVAWAQRIQARPAVERGLCVNRTWGEDRAHCKERHEAADIDKALAEAAHNKRVLSEDEGTDETKKSKEEA